MLILHCVGVLMNTYPELQAFNLYKKKNGLDLQIITVISGL